MKSVKVNYRDHKKKNPNCIDEISEIGYKCLPTKYNSKNEEKIIQYP